MWYKYISLIYNSYNILITFQGMESIDLLQYRNILPPEKVEPPKITLHQEFLDTINCSPE